MSSNRRRRGGDFLAVLLLFLIVAGLCWLWWHQKHSKKIPRHKSVAAAKPPAQLIVSQPIVKPPPPDKPLVQPAPPPAPLTTNPSSSLVVTPEKTTDLSRPVHDVFEGQIALARRGISPGSLDAAMGSQTRAAIAAFQRSQNLPATGTLDAATRAKLTLDTPLLTTYTVTTNDLARLQPLGKTWLAKSQQTALEYETELELVAEKSHSHPELIRRLNLGVNWMNIAAGTVLQIPDLDYPAASNKAAFAVIHLADKFLEAFDTETNLLAHFPCSIAANVEKRT